MIDRYLFRGKREKDEQWEYGAFWQSNSSIIDKSGYSQKVIPETVGQCTGRKDKNGKLIFEGDIVKSETLHRIYCVVYKYCYYSPFDCLTPTYCEVIGNIYDEGINNSKNSEKK